MVFIIQIFGYSLFIKKEKKKKKHLLTSKFDSYHFFPSFLFSLFHIVLYDYHDLPWKELYRKLKCCVHTIAVRSLSSNCWTQILDTARLKPLSRLFVVGSC